MRSCSPTAARVRLDLYINRSNKTWNTAVFDALQRDREAIERGLGMPLAGAGWATACPVAWCSSGLALRPLDGDQQALHDWCVANLLKLKAVLTPRLQVASVAASEAPEA